MKISQICQTMAEIWPSEEIHFNRKSLYFFSGSYNLEPGPNSDWNLFLQMTISQPILTYWNDFCRFRRYFWGSFIEWEANLEILKKDFWWRHTLPLYYFNAIGLRWIKKDCVGSIKIVLNQVRLLQLWKSGLWFHL